MSLRVLETSCRFASPGLTLCLDADCSPLSLLEPWASVCRLWEFPKESERASGSLSGLQDSHRCFLSRLEVLDSQTRKIALSWLSR